MKKITKKISKNEQKKFDQARMRELESKIGEYEREVSNLKTLQRLSDAACIFNYSKINDRISDAILFYEEKIINSQQTIKILQERK